MKIETGPSPDLQSNAYTVIIIVKAKGHGRTLSKRLYLKTKTYL